MSESLLILNPKIKNYSKRYIWGTEQDAFILLAQLVSYRIPVEGFISSDEDEIGMEILNKPAISLDMIENKEDTLIIADPKSSAGITAIEIVTDLFALSESFTAEKVVVYGAGEVGESLVSILSARGIQIACFLDRDKSGQQLCGIPIYHPQRIKEMGDDTVIIEAGRFWQEMDDTIRQAKPGIQTFYVDFLALIGGIKIKINDFNLLPLTCVWVLINFIRTIPDRKIILLGDHVENARGYKEVLECFGYKDLSIMAVNESEACEDAPLLEEILYEEDYLLVICETAPSPKRKIEERIEELGVSRDDWVSIMESIPLRSREFMIDLNLDHTYKMNHIPGLYLYGKEKETDVKIVTLGGSTTVEQGYFFSSWSKILFEKYCGENITLYNGGITTYTSLQELIKLVRDILYLKPDIIVVYDGVNDAWEQFFPFLYGALDHYKEDIYEHMVYECHKGVRDIFAGIKPKDIFERWLKNIESMYAIAQMQDIRFFSFIQPMLGSQKIHTKHGLAHRKIGDALAGRERISTVKLFRAQGKEIEKTHPYIHDLSHIFDEKDVYIDHCHVWESGNEIIADSIWEVIEPSVKEIMERKERGTDI